jgi:hypothetical protein
MKKPVPNQEKDIDSEPFRAGRNLQIPQAWLLSEGQPH